MELSLKDRELLERLEEELWREDTRFNLERMNVLLAPDFFEFGRSGRVYKRDETLAAEPEAIDALLPLPEFEARLIHPDIAHVTYNSAVTYDGVVQHGRRSSIWSRTPDGWMLRFHQGTPIQTGAQQIDDGNAEKPSGDERTQ